MQRFISSKPYQQWCKARGLNFATHMEQFPLIATRLYIPKIILSKVKLTLWEKVKAFFRY